MIPVKIKPEDSEEDVRRKLIQLFDDIYDKFYRVNDNLYDFSTNRHKIKITSVSVDSDN